MDGSTTSIAHTNVMLASPSTSIPGFSPSQIATAYGLSQLPQNGQGQTIAIIDAFDDPKLLNSTNPNFSTSDLAQFDAQWGLPDPPSFKKLNEFGGTNHLPGVDPAGVGTNNWEVEEALDVEWAHAMAPMANIVLIECASDSANDLYTGVLNAAGLPGVTVVSMSWGSDEDPSETGIDSLFTHSGVTYVAATGDLGSPGEYPAYSPNVVAVGGTALFLNSDNTYNSEVGWTDSGGGISTVESEPAYQLSVQNTGFRSTPDVSFIAANYTGVGIYDSYNSPGAPWYRVGGTSVGAPCWAGIIALANQARTSAGLGNFSGSAQALQALYSLPPSDFHDVTTGSNGDYTAGAGYDEVTGIGSPVANLLVADLAGEATRLVVTSQPPSSVTAGAGFGLTVAAEDYLGDVISDASGTVTLTLASDPGGVSLHGTLTAPLVNGQATFTGLNITKVASGYTIKATVSGLVSATSSPINVTPSTATHLDVTTQPPTTVTAGAAFGLVGSVEDAFNNVVTNYSGSETIFLAANPGGGTLGGTLTVPVANGAANFSGLTLTSAANGYAIKMTSTGLTGVTSNSFNVVAASATQLVITTQPPASINAAAAFGLIATAEDPFGNPNLTTTGNVTVSLAANPGGGMLGGTLTVPLSNGVATYSGLSINEPGNGYTLQVTATGLASATTNPGINVSPVAPVAAIVGPTSGWRGQGQTFTFSATDVSPSDVAAGFTFTVDWGDGSTPQTASGAASKQLTHSFDSSGSFTVSVTATDHNSLTSAPVTSIIQISAVQLIPDQQNPALTDLVWNGTSGADSVSFQQISSNSIRVTESLLNGQVANNVQTYSGITGRVIGQGWSGSDQLSAAGLSTTQSTLDGGAGNNTLYGGSAGDILIGGSNGGEGRQGNNVIIAGNGNNTIYGNGVTGAEGATGGNNLIIGGSGADTIYGSYASAPKNGGEGGQNLIVGGGGQDTIYASQAVDGPEGGHGSILIAGTTALNQAALASVLAEWTSSDSAAVKLADIQGTGSGGVNGTNYLQPGETVLHDASVDHLYGDTNGSPNWFFYSPSTDVVGRAKVADTLTTVP